MSVPALCLHKNSRNLLKLIGCFVSNHLGWTFLLYPEVLARAIFVLTSHSCFFPNISMALFFPSTLSELVVEREIAKSILWSIVIFFIFSQMAQLSRQFERRHIKKQGGNDSCLKTLKWPLCYEVIQFFSIWHVKRITFQLVAILCNQSS